MYFISLKFIVFFLAFLTAYFLIPPAKRYMVICAGNLFFYCFGNAKYLLLILGITILMYGGGLLLERNKRKLFLALFVAAIILVLVYFKYLGFIANNLNFILRRVFGQELFVHNPILPVGLSFCVFQSINYLADVYKKNISAEKDIFCLSAFLFFFPTLLCGPIQKARILLPQIKEPKGFESENGIKGFYFFVWGMFEKIIIADKLGILIENLYSNTESTVNVLLAVFLYSIYIYADFCAYSDMARGVAKIMGFEVGRNFINPYFSTSLSEFWRRWHVSLNDWFVENIYIPMGGSRKGSFKKCINIMIVFFVSGIWHGAAWHFIAWGVINGALVLVSNIIKPVKSEIYSFLKVSEDVESIVWLRRFIVFVIISFTWLFFRNGFMITLGMLKNLCRGPFNFSFDITGIFGSSIMAFAELLVLGVFVFVQAKRSDENNCYKVIKRQPFVVQGVTVGILLTVIIFVICKNIYSGGLVDGGSQFIYFKF